MSDKVRASVPIGAKIKCAGCGAFLGTVGRKKPIRCQLFRGDFYCTPACAYMTNAGTKP